MMKPCIGFFLAASIAFGQLANDATSPQRRLMRAHQLRQAQSQNQSVMLARGRGPRAVRPRQTSFDNSGNSMLKGAYFVRQVFFLLDSNTSAITQAISLTGTMTFDGNGNYSFSGQQLNSANQSTASSYSVNGTYAVSASALVQIQTPVSTDTMDTEYGGVGAG